MKTGADDQERQPVAGAVERPEFPGLPTPAAPLRLRHVDSLRAVAALAVVWTHCAGSLRSTVADGPAFLSFLYTAPPDLKMGRIGVMIFFAVSGFVICRSFNGPREGGTQRFVIRRFCRLYPAYWASIPCAALNWWLWGRKLTWPLLTAAATMLPGAFGQEYLAGVYWTLGVELIFYTLCLVLYRLNWLDRSMALGGLALASASSPRLIFNTGRLLGFSHPGLPGQGDMWMISLAVMFWGALFRLVYDETGGFRRRPFACPGTWFLVLLYLAILDLWAPGFKRLVFAGALPAGFPALSPAIALAVFALWVAVLRVDFRPLTFLGVISYSLYLFHPTILEGVMRGADAIHLSGRWPLWTALTMCVGLSTGVSALTYRWIERPAIALGKRWVAAIPQKVPEPAGGRAVAG